MELMYPGQRVVICVEPPCRGEFGAHGIGPYVNGLYGYVVDMIRSETGHTIGVRLDGQEHIQNFKPSELMEVRYAG